MPVIVPYVSAEEIYGGRATHADIARYASSLPLEPCLRVLGQLLWYWKRDQRLADQTFAGWLDRAAYRRWDRSLGHRPLVFPTRIASTMRAMILFGSHAPPQPRADARGELLQLAHLALAVTDADHVGPAPGEGAEARAFLESFFLRQHDAARWDTLPACAIGRAHRMFVELPDESHRAEVANARIHDEFIRDRGTTLARYLAICGGIALRFESWNGDPNEWQIGPHFFRETSLSPEEIRAVFNDISATPERLAKELAEWDRSGPEPGLSDLRTFFAFPLCEVGPDRYIPLYPPGLLDRLSGDGIYKRLRLIFRSSRGVLQAAVGRLFETYAMELARASFAERSGHVFDEPSYRNKEGPDLAIVDAEPSASLALIEIGTQNVTFDKTLLWGDLAAFEKDTETLIIPRIRQLDAKIRDLRAGALTYRGVPSDIEIWPVILLMNGFPIGPLISDLTAAAVVNTGALHSPGIRSLSILSAADFELAMSWIERSDRPFTTILADWHGTGAAREMPLGEFISRAGKDLAPPRVPGDAFGRAAEMWVEELGLRASSPRFPAPPA